MFNKKALIITSILVVMTMSLISPCLGTEYWVNNKKWVYGRNLKFPYQEYYRYYDNAMQCREVGSESQMDTFYVGDTIDSVRALAWCNMRSPNWWSNKGGEVRGITKGYMKYTDPLGMPFTYTTGWHWAKTAYPDWYIYKYVDDQPYYALHQDWTWLGNWDNLNWVFEQEGVVTPEQYYNDASCKLIELKYYWNYGIHYPSASPEDWVNRESSAVTTCVSNSPIQ